MEGLDLEEQGALFVCEKCPNAVDLDLVSVNFTRKFFFGRQLNQQPQHFHHLTSLSVGKIDWSTFKQVSAGARSSDQTVLGVVSGPLPGPAAGGRHTAFLPRPGPDDVRGGDGDDYRPGNFLPESPLHSGHR